MTQDGVNQPTQQPKLEVTSSPQFASWLSSSGASLAVSSYQAGKIFLIGTNPNGGLSIYERTFERSKGLGVGQNTLWAGTSNQLWKFDNFLDPNEPSNGFDAMYVPVTGHMTGNIDIHDIHIDESGQPTFVATGFNCIATLAERGNFCPVWRPPFIDRLVPEDRCHLNGLAFEDGELAYATCVSTSNVADGWRSERDDGGVMVYIPSDEIVASGLSMPHSPRIYHNELYVLQAGTGEFGIVDEGSGKFEPICLLPGFARGLAFMNGHAIIGLSRPRDTVRFAQMKLGKRLAKEGISPRTGVAIVNLKTGKVENHLTFEGPITELHDVRVLPGIRRPMLHGHNSDCIRLHIQPTE